MTNLILVPTEGEHERLCRYWGQALPNECAVEICGFGQIAAAARTSALIAKLSPRIVVLVGLAGTFDSRCQIGKAYRFQRVRCDGIGVGLGTDRKAASEIGWNHFGEIEDEIKVQPFNTKGASDYSQLVLLSVCAASASTEEAHQRKKRFPEAVAEDMESFGVALACQMAQCKLEIVRGISNQVGNRDHTNWLVDESLDAAAQIVASRFEFTR